MPQKRRKHLEDEVRGLTQELADYLDEDPAEIERQAAEIDIEDPWAAEKDD